MEQAELTGSWGTDDADRPEAEAVAVAGDVGQSVAEVVDAADLKFPDPEGTVDLAVTQVDYTIEGQGSDEYPVVHVFGRTPDGDAEHVRVLGFEPYFYAPTASLDDDDLDRDVITRTETGYESIRGEQLTKICTQTPRDVGQIRDEFDHFEADILFPNRLLIDKDIGGGVRVPVRRLESGAIQVPHDELVAVDPPETDLRVNTFDIEVDDRSGFPEDGEEPIVCLTSHDSHEDEYVAWLYDPGTGVTPPEALDEYQPFRDDIEADVRVFETEEAMLDSYVDYIERVTDPDVITGWNCLPGDARVLLADGTERVIRDVQVGDTVVGNEDQRTTVAEVTDKWKSEKPVLEFDLADGTSLRSSSEHRIMIGDDDSVDWKEGGDVEPGEYVLKPRKLTVEDETVPALSELVPIENQRFADTDAVRSFKETLPHGAVSDLADQFDLATGTLYHPRTDVWTPKRCSIAAEEFDVPLPDGGRTYRRTRADLDRQLTEREAYLAGLVLTDGTMSLDDGVRFYNTRTELHDQFADENELLPDGTGCYAQNVLDYAMLHAFNGLGIPFGDKNDGPVDLSTVYELPEEYIARFLAGVIDGDGNVSDSVTVAAENRSIGRWYAKLFRRLGVYAHQRENVVRIPDAERDLERLKETVLPHMCHSEKSRALSNLSGGTSGRTEDIPYALFEAESGSDARRIARDKHRRDIALKRHETTVEAWEEYVFVAVENVEQVGTETTYDIETTTHNFVADDCLVHNCDDFDAPYLIDRMEELQGPHHEYDLNPERLSRIDEVWRSDWGGPTIKGRVVFDLLYAYKRTQFTELESYRLDAVGEQELGAGKERYTGDIGDLWEEDPTRLLEYNLRDVELCVELDRKRDIISFWDEVRTFVGCKLEDAPTPGDAVDVYVLHKVHGNFALPSKGRADAEDYEGGAVFDPITGIKENVSVLDLKSLYPMCMVTINASPETKVDPEDYADDTYRAPNGTHFRKEPDGVIREMVDELLAEREQKKAERNDHDPDSQAYEQYDRQQQAVKVIMNCFTSDTDVLTPNGVRNIRDLEVGDDVYSIDPETMRMETKLVTETHAYPEYRGDLVDVETSKVDFSVTPNHRMLVRKDDTNGVSWDEFRFVEAGDLNESSHYELPHGWGFSHQDALGETMDVIDLVREHTDVDITLSDGGTKAAAKYGTPNVSDRVETDAFLEFLAWYITEGSLYEADTANYRVKIAQEEQTERERIANLVEQFVDYYYADDRSVSFSSRLWSALLGELCGRESETKRIPELVFEASREQKELFLDTLIAGDGDRQVNSWRYSTVSDQLRDDVLRLCAHLGLTASYNRDSGTWRIYCTENAKNSIRMHRSGGRSTADDGVYCVTVADNNTLLAGRNGKFQFVGNSLYGVLGWDRFRLYDREMGAAVTATGREVIEHTQSAANDVGYEVAYGDTDSVMLEIGEEAVAEEVPDEVREAHPDADESDLRQITGAIETGYELEESINDSYDEFALEELNAHEHRFQIEFEKLYRRFFQAGKKKRYAGHIVWKEGKHVDDIDITGFEYKRSDIAPITKAVQRRVIEMIVTGEDVDDVEEYVHDVIEDFEAGNVDLNDVGIPGGIGKRLTAYDTDTAQVRGAKYANHLLGTNFQRGSKPKRLYLKKVHPEFFRRLEAEEGFDPQSDALYGEFKRDPDVICFEYADQIPDAFEIDWDKMLEKTLKGPIARIIEALDLSWDEVKSGQRQTGLGQF
ncbi:DNA polymerase domain-containing protein [Haloplanus pelagicus]|uniref:DNA polymerase domain-containing protein n=1 Tax=Haloplanus pelagicus TaxID=2949995 RepID=UPI002041D993|nr:DNA polymerase domain-containing protein [Haloplanus sp. HW8-1]